MSRLARQSALPAAATGLATVLNGLVLRLLLRADESAVYILGTPLHWVCSLKSHTGLPCPTCGMTRSVVLSLHGDFGRAWTLAPGGPVVVLGCLLFAGLMFALAAIEWLEIPRWEARLKLSIRRGLWIYAAVGTVVWLGGWAATFEAALRGT